MFKYDMLETQLALNKNHIFKHGKWEKKITFLNMDILKYTWLAGLF